jgi:Flp pilus assembly protein TadB
MMPTPNLVGSVDIAHPIQVDVTVTANASQHRASRSPPSLQLDIITQQAAEAQQQADAAAAALAAAPAAGGLAAAESAAAEAAQQARQAAAQLETLQHEVHSLERERDALQQRLSGAQQQLKSAVQRQPGHDSTLTNGGATVAGKLQDSADAAEPQLAPGAADASGAGSFLLCCAEAVVSAGPAQALWACLRMFAK